MADVSQIQLPDGTAYNLKDSYARTNYVQKAGDSMTGTLTFNKVSSAISYQGTKNTYAMIKFIDNTANTNGNGIYIGGGGQTIIGGGESANTMAAQVGTAGDEIMYVGNDQNVVIFTNIQSGWDNRKTFTFDTSGNLTATKFIGALQGNADTATKATQDSDGNTINSTYLKLSGGTLTGQLSLASAGLKTSNSAGYTLNQYGNFIHQSNTSTDYWNISNNAGNATFSVYYQSGNVNAAGNVTAPKFIGTLEGDADTWDGYHCYYDRYKNTYEFTQPTADTVWYVQISTANWNSNLEVIQIRTGGDNKTGSHVLYTGSRGSKWWGYGQVYSHRGLAGVKKSISNSDNIYLKFDADCTSCVIRTSFDARVAEIVTNVTDGYTEVPSVGGLYGNYATFTSIAGDITGSASSASTAGRLTLANYTSSTYTTHTSASQLRANLTTKKNCGIDNTSNGGVLIASNWTSNTYNSEIFMGMGDNPTLYYRGKNNGTYCDWRQIITAAGGTMTGQLLTSFKSAVAVGSRQSDATTITDLVADLRYSSGCMGSFSLNTAYTKDGITIAAKWYNYLWIPHRSGGVNGVASGDNCSYGTLLLAGMTGSGCYLIRFANSSITELKDLYAPATSGNVTGTVAIANGGTGATTRLNAAKNLTNEAVATPGYIVGLTENWGKFGYTSIAQLKTTLGLGSNAYTSTAYLPLAGGTMTGTLKTPADNSKGLEPADDGVGRIGSPSAKYNAMYAYEYVGNSGVYVTTNLSSPTSSDATYMWMNTNDLFTSGTWDGTTGSLKTALGSLKIGLGAVITYKDFTCTSASVPANSSKEFASVNVAKTGYTPIGFLKYNTGDGSITPVNLYLEGNNAILVLRNVSSTAKSVAPTFRILYMKTTS